jgi:hypothetical protein
VEAQWVGCGARPAWGTFAGEAVMQCRYLSPFCRLWGPVFDSEANGIHGTKVLIVLGIPPPPSSIPTKPSDHGCLIVLRRTISYTRHESLTILQGSPTSLLFSKGRRLFASRSQGRLHRAQWDLMDGHDRSDRV